MIIIEFVESTWKVILLVLVVVLILGLCNGKVNFASDGVECIETVAATDEMDIVETVSFPETADLTSLHILGTHSSMLSNISTGSIEDAYGNTYDGPYFDLCSYGDHGGEIDAQAYTDLVAGGHYRYLSGTFFSRANQNESYKIEFFIYADEELVYSSGPIDRRTKPIDFTVDIANCDVIRVMSSSIDNTSFATNPGIVLVNAQVHN